MADVDELLDRWRQAGVIDSDTAARIREYEASGAGTRAVRPGVSEALIYIGLAVVGVGALLLGALVWPTLDAWARVAVTGLPGLAALGLGFFLRDAEDAGMRRGGSLAWVLAVALLGSCFAIVLHESGWGGDDAALAVALFAVAGTLALWLLLPSHPQLVALAIAVWFLALALGMRSQGGELGLFAGVLVAFAAVWIGLAELGILRPRESARVLGAFGLASGSFLLGLDDGLHGLFELVAFVAGGGLVAASVYRGSFVYMVFGVGLLFLAFVTFTLQRVPDPVVGALVLMFAGVLLVAAVLLLARWRPWRAEVVEG